MRDAPRARVDDDVLELAERAISTVDRLTQLESPPRRLAHICHRADASAPAPQSPNLGDARRRKHAYGPSTLLHRRWSRGIEYCPPTTSLIQVFYGVEIRGPARGCARAHRERWLTADR